VDYAGNKETKDISDVTITFDRLKPDLMLTPITELTGSNELIVTVKMQSENLSQISLEYARLLENSEDILEWIPIESEWSDEGILIGPLIDGYTYYFRANPVDLAGNDYSREPYEYTVFIDTNTTGKIELPVTPLKPIMIGKLRNMEITVDEDGDGIFEKNLEEYTGIDLTAMKANQYWIDYTEGEVIFGDGEDGYKPPKNSSISLIFKSFDLSTTIDITPPDPVEVIDYVIEDRNNVTITWERPDDTVGFVVESKDNFSMPWKVLENIDYTDSKSLNYKVSNLSAGFHYYRIVSVDRMGYTNPNMKDEHIRVIIEAEVNNIIEAEPKQTDDLYIYGIVAVVLGSIALFGASRLMKGKNVEEIEGPVLIPADNYGSEEPEIVAVEKPETFSVVSGSQFSRQLMFICEKGCMKEFEVLDEEDEVMCPHCGTLGNSPL